jgi:hypothetical protein
VSYYQCPVDKRINRIKICTAALNGKCRRGFTAVDKKGNCVKRKKKGGAG